MSSRVEVSPAFEKFIRWFEDHGALSSPVMIRKDALSQALGLPERTISTYTARAKIVGLLKVNQRREWGKGSSPNEYRLVMSWDKWAERAPLVLKRMRKQKITENAKARVEAAKYVDENIRRQAEDERRIRRDSLIPFNTSEALDALVDEMLAIEGDEDLLDGW